MIVWMTLAKLELLKIRFLVKGRAWLSCIVKFVRRLWSYSDRQFSNGRIARPGTPEALAASASSAIMPWAAVASKLKRQPCCWRQNKHASKLDVVRCVLWALELQPNHSTNHQLRSSAMLAGLQSQLAVIRPSSKDCFEFWRYSVDAIFDLALHFTF